MSVFVLVLTPKLWLQICGFLLVSFMQLHRALQYEITLRGNELIIARIFCKPHYYSTERFLGFAQTNGPHSRPLLLFEDGQQFAFTPKLKTEALSLRYVPVKGFIEYWTERLQNPAQSEGEVWPDDVIE
jgi:hypothetical protein